MYTPEPFKIEDEQSIHDFINAYPFATLVSHTNGTVLATHLPVDRLDDGKYYAHMALNNPQSNIEVHQEVLVIFTGPHAYISPYMYASEFNVPTWNYSAVHCYGTMEFIDDETKTWNLFHKLVERYEGKEGWQLPNEEKFKNLTAFIRFFEFKITRMEAKFKFNQNKSEEDIQSVIAGLRGVGNDDAADFMQRITAF